MRHIHSNALPVALFTIAALATAAATPALAIAPPTHHTQQQEQEAEETGLRAIAVKMGAEGLVAPILLERVLPEYTPAAERAGTEGDVYIEAVVTDEGSVVEPKLIRGIGDDGLDQAALAAISQWLFKPGTRDGDAVHVLALFTVTFRKH